MAQHIDLQFIASGRRGAHGVDGHDGSNGTFAGQDGRDGGNASSATPGEAGGSCDVTLGSWITTPQLPDGALLVQGVAQPLGRQPSRLDRNLTADTLGFIRVQSSGGAGGHGGNGGDGGHGARGSSGRDATRYSNGGDGGPGGDGGDGGHGSNGAQGGNGGRCRVTAAEEDMFLFMAVASSQSPSELVQGGKGGKRGLHGSGGAGGSGGSGGSSYSWTESESYTDSNGNTQTRTTHHSNSGGSSGRSGSRGWSPSTPLHDGRDGAPGVFELRVAMQDGQILTYPNRYDLELRDFELFEDDFEDVDGIFEFGEVVHVKHLLLRNRGAMPTPPHQRIRLVLQPGSWAHPIPTDELFIQESIPPGGEVSVEGSLRFMIARPLIEEAGEPLIIREEIQPVALQLGPQIEGTPERQNLYQRRYTNVTLTRTLEARFPVENRSGLVGLRSLAPGERTRLVFDICNVSHKPIGHEADRERKVGVQIELIGGDVGVESLVLYDMDGEEIELGGEMDGFAGYFQLVPNINAHTVVHPGAMFGFKDDVEAYVGATLRASLWIEEFGEPGVWRLAQRREATFRAEPAYRYRPDSRIILVTNNNTTREGYLAWVELLEQQLGLGVDHWSLARYGHFDQQRDLDDGTNLKVHLEDKVALVLNQHFQPRGTDDSDLPTDYVLGRDFREGATANNTHMFVVGSPQFEARQLLEPTSDMRRGGDDFPDFSRFLEKEEKTGGPLVTELFKEDITTHWDEVKVHDWTFFTTPDAAKRTKMMRKRSVALMNELVEMHPNRRYVLVEHEEDDAKQDGRSWLVFPRWELGHVEVRRTLNSETSAAIVLQADETVMNARAFILSDRNRYGVLLALPFETKLDRLNWLLQQDGEFEGHEIASARMLAMAILTDLSEEQSALSRGSMSLTPSVLEQKLSNLGRLLGEPLHTAIEQGSNKWNPLFELYAGLLALAKTNRPWWKIWGRDRAIAGYVLDQLEKWSSQTFDAYAIAPDGDVAMDSQTAEERASERFAQLDEAITRRRTRVREEVGLKMNQGHAARDFFESPDLVLGYLERDLDVWATPEERVWSARDFQRAREDEAARKRKQDRLRAINEEMRSALLEEEQPRETSATPEEGKDAETRHSPIEQELAIDEQAFTPDEVVLAIEPTEEEEVVQPEEVSVKVEAEA